MNTKLVIYLMHLVLQAAAQNLKTETCLLEKSNKNGICKPLYNCQSAMENLYIHKIRPETCGFQGLIPVVCCTEDDTDVHVTEKPVIKYKSNKICKEYEKYTYKNITSLSLLQNESQTTVKVDTCTLFPGNFLIQAYGIRKGEFPHLAEIGYVADHSLTSEYDCVGAIISEQFIITSGHCADSPIYGKVKFVLLGFNNNTKDRIKVNVTEIIKHPLYKPPALYHNLALLRLGKSVEFSTHIRPTCLHTGEHELDPKSFLVGLNKLPGEPIEMVKRRMDLKTYEECAGANNRDIYSFPNGVDDKSQICYVSDWIKCQLQNTIQGIVQVYNKDVVCMYNLVGIAAKNVCDSKSGIGIFTRVSNYIDWIEKIVWA